MYDLPDYVKTALNTLQDAGFEAHLAGGCVRDFIMGVPPHDFDIATNASPQRMKEVFSGFTVIPTGEKHGTVTVVIENQAIEVTAYRVDGNYSDNRRPDKVTFTSDLHEDLKRRDFTMNAMAMDINGNITDLFGGRSDIRNRTVKAVGDAETRFREDALRILRALRFASRLGFTLEKKTDEALRRCRGLLKNISPERIGSEFTGILCGRYAEEVLREYRDVIAVFIPEAVPCFDFQQHTPYHKYDVWEHTVRAVGASPQKENIRIAMFFHDIAKPDCFRTDENGQGHFKGHAELSAVKARDIMKRLRFSNKAVKNAVTLIRLHRGAPDNRYEMRKLIGSEGIGTVMDLIEVQRADSLAKQDFCAEDPSEARKKLAREIIENGDCVTLKDLSVDGRDLMGLGFAGREIADGLNVLLDKVMRDQLSNSREALMSFAEGLLSKNG